MVHRGKMNDRVKRSVSDFEKALKTLKENPGNPSFLLAAILRRDQVARQVEIHPLTNELLHRLEQADQFFKSFAWRHTALPWQTWRQSFLPPPSHWWWFLDQEQESIEEKKRFPLIILSGLLMTFTLSLTIDIIQRMWSSGPDLLAVTAATLSVVLTTSPLIERGRDLVIWLFDRTRLPVYWRSYSMLLTSSLALVVVLALRLALPGLGLYYNNEGVIALQQGDLTRAKQLISRAADLNPDYAAAYYNLADAYQEIGDVGQAVAYYQKSLAADRNLDVGYASLGYVLILDEKPGQAIPVLFRGLAVARDDATRSALWTNLGWAYLKIDSPREANAALENALILNPNEASAHCAMGLVSEKMQAAVDQVKAHWENCLRYNVPSGPRGEELASLAQAHLFMINNK